MKGGSAKPRILVRSYFVDPAFPHPLNWFDEGECAESKIGIV